MKQEHKNKVEKMVVIIIWLAKGIHCLTWDPNHGGGPGILVRKGNGMWGKSALNLAGVEHETFCM